MNRIGKILLFVVMLSGTTVLGLDDGSDTNSKMKAVYLYQFTKLVEWPANAKSGNFVIGILGTSNVYGKLNEVAGAKKVVNQPIEVKTFRSPGEISGCHLLFIPADYDNLKDILPKMKNSFTLLVADKPGLARQGAAINFVVKESKIKYELNKNNAEKYNLKVGQQLTQLAATVIE